MDESSVVKRGRGRPKNLKFPNGYRPRVKKDKQVPEEKKVEAEITA